MVRPAGRLALAVQPGGLASSALGAPPVLVKVTSVIGWPCMKVCAVASTSTGATRGGAGALTVMSTVAVSAPMALVAVAVTVTAPEVGVIGVPVMRQDWPLSVRPMVRPAGRLALAVQPGGLASSALGAPPVLVKATSVIGWPCMKVCAVASTSTGAARGGAGGLTVMSTVAVSAPMALVAVAVTVTAPEVGIIGVPVMRHDWPLSVRPMVRPAGRLVAVQPGVEASSALGAPPVLAKVMSVMGWPCVNVLAGALVSAGASSGVVDAGGLTVMSTVAVVVPPSLVAVTVTVTVTGVVLGTEPLVGTIGVPVMRHDRPFSVRLMVRPAGRLVAVQPGVEASSALGLLPVLVKMMSLIAWSGLKVWAMPSDSPGLRLKTMRPIWSWPKLSCKPIMALPASRTMGICGVRSTSPEL